MRRFAVIGLGRFGQKLAVALAMSGAEVIAIDKDRELVELIRDQVTHAVRLDSTDEEALKAQNIADVDVAIVGIGQGTGQGFESAVLTVVNLRQIGVKQIYARAESLIAGEVFSKIGAMEVIYPEIEAAQRWAYKLIVPQISEKIDFAPGYSLARITAPASFDGKTVMDLQLRQKYNVNLVLIKRGEHRKGNKTDKEPIISIPTGDTVIYQDDILMVAGSDTDLAQLPQEWLMAPQWIYWVRKTSELTGELLDPIKTRAVKTVAPERIYLFGSRTAGSADPGSDLDLLMIVPDTDQSHHELAFEARANLRDFIVPMDLIVCTHSEIENPVTRLA